MTKRGTLQSENFVKRQFRFLDDVNFDETKDAEGFFILLF